MSAVVDYAAIWDYEAKEKEDADCNLCGEDQIVQLTGMFAPDRYGYLVRASLCADCGLIYLNPRMTAAAYREFYESGAYRRLVSAYHGREINAETIQPEQREYAREVSDFIEPHMTPDHDKLLDVGGSTGVVAAKLSEHYTLEPTVLDPAASETACAAGIEVLDYSAEQLVTTRTWDLITLCQTIDHLLDPMAVLVKLRDCLSDSGLLFVDIVDFAKTREIKIDHPFNFTEATMSAYLAKVGLHEVARERAPDGVHVRFLCAR